MFLLEIIDLSFKYVVTLVTCETTYKMSTLFSFSIDTTILPTTEVIVVF